MSFTDVKIKIPGPEARARRIWGILKKSVVEFHGRRKTVDFRARPEALGGVGAVGGGG